MKLKYIFLSVLLCTTNTYAAKVPFYRIDLSPYDKNIYDSNGNIVNGNGTNNNGQGNGEGGGEGNGEGGGENITPPECGPAAGQTFTNSNPPPIQDLCVTGESPAAQSWQGTFDWNCSITPEGGGEQISQYCQANRTIVTTDYSSCRELLSDAGQYQNQNGVYKLTINGQQIDVYCDLTQNIGGFMGWTLITAQKESAPVGWNDGVNASYNPLADSFSFNGSQIPSHYRVAFGGNLNQAFVLMLDYTYTAGEISNTLVFSESPRRPYYIHRSSSENYFANDPDMATSGDAQFNNTLTVDRSATWGREWSFSPNATNPDERGYSFNGVYLGDSSNNQLWTIWVH